MNSSSSISSVASAERPGLLLPALLLAASLVFFGVPGLGGDLLDLAFQGLFFGADGWLISWDSGFWHALLYKGPKALLIAWLAFVLWCAIKPDLGPDWMGRRRAFYLLASSFAVVLVCTQLRAFSKPVLDASLKAAKEVYAEFNGKNEDFKKLYDSYFSFQREQIQWNSVAEHRFDQYMKDVKL